MTPGWTGSSLFPAHSGMLPASTDWIQAGEHTQDRSDDAAFVAE
jgi:hypothetical protein